MKDYWSMLGMILIGLLFWIAISCSNDNDNNVFAEEEEQANQANYVEIEGKQIDIALGSSTKNNFIILEREAFITNKLTLPKGTRIDKIEGNPYSTSFL